MTAADVMTALTMASMFSFTLIFGLKKIRTLVSRLIYLGLEYKNQDFKNLYVTEQMLTLTQTKLKVWQDGLSARNASGVRKALNRLKKTPSPRVVRDRIAQHAYVPDSASESSSSHASLPSMGYFSKRRIKDETKEVDLNESEITYVQPLRTQHALDSSIS